MVHLTTKRRATVLDRLKHGNVSRLSADAQIVYVLGMLVADEAGGIDRSDLDRAAADQATVAIARELLRKALT